MSELQLGIIGAGVMGRRHEPLVAGRLDVVRDEPLSRQLAHFCAVLRGEATPLVTATDATRTLAATFAVSDR